MKKIYFVAIAALITFLTSCGGSDGSTDLPDPTPGKIFPASVEINGIEGSEHTLTFNAPAAWTAELHQSSKWLEAKPMQGGAGENTITLTAKSDNMGVFSRKATVVINIDGYKAYNIEVEQKSATTGDIKVEGHVNENGEMSLISDRKGTMFSDTIYVTSEKQWSLEVDAASQNVLSFEKKEVETNKTQVIVTADYAKFTETYFAGKFYIKTTDGNKYPVSVNAQSSVAVYDTKAHLQNERERTSYNLVDTIQRGVFQTTFYVDANVRWTINNTLDWVEVSEASKSNIKTDGTINKDRQIVTLKVKAEKLSKEGKSGNIKLVDDRGKELKVIDLIFTGAGAGYIDYKLSWPASDTSGNPWAFEAHKSTEQADGPINRRRISMDFTATTAEDYSSIEAAPFHLIMVDGTNGIAHKKECHWASLKMGDAAESKTTDAGMYQKQLIIVANERGDADDKNKVTDATLERFAFIYLVPNDVKFNDLWNSDGTLKDAYKDDLTLISQKNDPFADYKFAFTGLAEGAHFDVAPAGESKTFNVAAGSYTKGGFVFALKNSSGDWVNTKDCTTSFTTDAAGNVTTVTVTFPKNEKKTGFGGVSVGADRTFRIQFSAFIADGESEGEGEESSSSQGVSKVIYTIYADQKLMAE